ncbi:MAG: RNA polymerase sigma factor region1.1 domain-containing protein, partial [Limnochordia bacterium]
MKKDLTDIKGLKTLIVEGKSAGELSYKQIMDTLQDVDLDPDQIDEVYQMMEKEGIN